MSFRQSNKCVLRLDEKSQDLLRYANKKRKQGLFNDVSIQVGNERFPCSRLVLSCYSAYFETMFETKMQEKYQNTIELQDCEEKDVKMLLDYMYGEEVAIDDKNVFSALAAADYLQIENVKTFCIEFLGKYLNIENCLDAVKAYSLYVPSKSADHIYNFISNNFLEIHKQEKFMSLLLNDLVSLLTQLNKNKLNQKHLFSAIIGWVANDREERKYDFPTLFQLIDLSEIPHQFLQQSISNDELVKQNADCLNLVVFALINTKETRSEQDNSNKTQQFEFQQTKILSIGGNPQNSVIQLNNISESESALTHYFKLPLRLKGHSASKVNTFVFCIGGTITRGLARYCTSSAFCLSLADQKKKEWKEVASMRERRSDHCSMWFKENIVVSGGQRGDEPLNSVERYESILNKWKQCQSMNCCRSGHAMTICNNRLYALGGVADKSEQSKLRSVEILSELNGKWETGIQMNKARYRFASVCSSGKIYAIGGQSKDGIENTVEIFVPEENKWFYVSQMHSARWGHAACVVDGKILVIGGRDKHSKEVTMIESYDPSKDSWFIVNKDLAQEFCGHCLVAE